MVELEDLHLNCHECSYKQNDIDTVKSFMADPINKDVPSHDIMYLCGACMDTLDIELDDNNQIIYY